MRETKKEKNCLPPGIVEKNYWSFEAVAESGEREKQQAAYVRVEF
jgi:hypothetical protein